MQAYIWKICVDPWIEPLNSLDYGWKRNEHGFFVPLWYTCQQLPPKNIQNEACNEKERREKTDRGKGLKQKSNNEEGNQPPQKRPRVISEEKVTSCDDNDNSNEDDFSDWERYSDFSSSDSDSDDSDW